MSDLRIAAQQALEAWQSHQHGKCSLEKAVERFDALRAALAQQAEPVLVQGELPPRYVARSPIQAEPVEPVAWECKAGGLKPLTQRQYDAQPLNIRRHYTRPAPPQRLPLTEEEIDKIFKHLCNTVGASCKTMARAVERAHGIKE